jgi:hypothetical protein
MPTTREREPQPDIEQRKQETRNALIAKQIIHTLGQPDDLVKVQVRQLWEDNYRVNVFVGLDLVSAKVAHSYFLVTDSAGNILASTPKVTNAY